MLHWSLDAGYVASKRDLRKRRQRDWLTDDESLKSLIVAETLVREWWSKKWYGIVE